jgi:LDH2 family malate/lactate/ureidoglycolate dehydrogenase
MTSSNEPGNDAIAGAPKFLQATIASQEGLGHEPIRIPRPALQSFTAAFFTKLGLTPEEAEGAAEILVTSDLRNIESHGVPRLDMYLFMFREKIFVPDAPFQIVRESGATALVDGGGGLGMVVGRKAMELAIRKARETGIGMVAVTNSSHFGMAGFYAEMAVKHDMIGLSMTNAAPQHIPTNGRTPRLGTNPLAFAAPAKEERPFLLDMATTAVAYGKIEIAARYERPVPLGWGFDENGQPTTDSLAILKSRTLNPLGSFSELSSHKGYGLASLVDILTGVLSGMGHSVKVSRLRAGHFFGALRIDAFRDVAEFKAEMDEFIRDMHATPPATGAERVYVAGEKEYLAQEENLRLGIPLHPKVVHRLRELGKEFGIAVEF